MTAGHRGAGIAASIYRPFSPRDGGPAFIRLCKISGRAFGVTRVLTRNLPRCIMHRITIQRLQKDKPALALRCLILQSQQKHRLSVGNRVVSELCRAGLSWEVLTRSRLASIIHRIAIYIMGLLSARKDRQQSVGAWLASGLFVVDREVLCSC